MNETNDTYPSETGLDTEHWLHAYEQMIRIRTFEEAEWAKRDPVKLLKDWRVKRKQAETGVSERIQQDVKVAFDDAVAFALGAPFPSESEVERHVYA